MPGAASRAGVGATALPSRVARSLPGQGAVGFGKSVLAAECAALLEPVCTLVWWVRAADRITARRDLLELSAALGLGVGLPDDGANPADEDDEDLGPLWEHLRQYPGWLLVYDEFDPDRFPLDRPEEWAPPVAYGSLLVTSRSEAEDPWGPDAPTVRLGSDRPLWPDDPADSVVGLSAGDRRLGSGVLLRPGLVATDAQLVRSVRGKVSVEWGSGRAHLPSDRIRFAAVPGGGATFGTEPVLALLEVPALRGRPGARLTAGPGTAVTNPVYVLGRHAGPLGARMRRAAVRTAQPDAAGGGDVLRLHGGALPEGFSGAAVVDSSGAVCGLVVNRPGSLGGAAVPEALTAAALTRALESEPGAARWSMSMSVLTSASPSASAEGHGGGQVFLSYSADDEGHSERVMEFLRFLRSQGVAARLGVPRPGSQLNEGDVLLVIPSPRYRRSASGPVAKGADEPTLLGREIAAVRRLADDDLREPAPLIVAAVLPGCSAADLPYWWEDEIYQVAEYTPAGAAPLLRLLGGARPPEVSRPAHLTELSDRPLSVGGRRLVEVLTVLPGMDDPGFRSRLLESFDRPAGGPGSVLGSPPGGGPEGGPGDESAAAVAVYAVRRCADAEFPDEAYGLLIRSLRTAGLGGALGRPGARRGAGRPRSLAGRAGTVLLPERGALRARAAAARAGRPPPALLRRSVAGGPGAHGPFGRGCQGDVREDGPGGRALAAGADGVPGDLPGAGAALLPRLLPQCVVRKSLGRLRTARKAARGRRRADTGRPGVLDGKRRFASAARCPLRPLYGCEPGTEYSRGGIRGLLASGRSADYRQTTRTIAEYVVDIARAGLRPCDPALLDGLPNAFAGEERARLKRSRHSADRPPWSAAGQRDRAVSGVGLSADGQLSRRSGICQSIGSWPRPASAASICGERAAAEEQLGRQRRRVRALHHHVPGGVDQRQLLLARSRPRARRRPAPRGRSTARITASVNFSQPLPLCELASCARTVSTALSSSTPCSAQCIR